MTWFDDFRRVDFKGKKLIGASFRGVPFFVEVVERSGGRRIVVHEFPLRDAPFVEDLGRKAIGFRVEGYVVGDDYLDQRDALLEALEKEGVGELVLPSYSANKNGTSRGPIRATVSSVSTRESRDAGGFATIAIEFAEAPTQVPVPVSVSDLPAKVSLSADAALGAVQAGLEEAYDTDGLPMFALASASTALTKAAAAVADKLAPIVTATEELAAFSAAISDLTAQATSLVRDPAAILGAFRGALDQLADTAAAVPGEVVGALIDAYGADLGPVVDAITATRARELANQTALTSALRSVLAIEAARLTPAAAYASLEEATAARDAAAAILEEQAELAGDTAYPALVELRAQVLRAVPGPRAFARVVTVTRHAAVPALLLAYQLYGSVANEEDIIARNKVRHPGFVFGTLKVLSDG